MSILATETTGPGTPEMTDRAANGSIHPFIEVWAGNERMRHIPPLDWMLDKLNVDLRLRIEKLLAPFERLSRDDARFAAAETELRRLGRALDRLAEAAKGSRNHYHPPSETVAHIRSSLEHATATLRSLDPNLLGRRFPAQTHERSRAEMIYSSLAALIAQVRNTVPPIAAIDADLIENLNEGLVRLSEPLRERLTA